MSGRSNLHGRSDLVKSRSRKNPLILPRPRALSVLSGFTLLAVVPSQENCQDYVGESVD